MGKRRKIRTGAGDLVTTPGPLHKQIEKANIARPKFKVPKHGDRESKEKFKFIDPDLGSKIFVEAKKQWEEEEKMEMESDDDGVLEEKHDIGEDIDELLAQHEEQLEELKLSDVIVQKEKRVKRKKIDKDNATKAEFADLDPKVVELFTEIGQVLSKYRSGRIPKAFKIVPTLLNWEQIIELTCPEQWTAAAMLHATRIFASTATPSQCQKFYNLILLPRVRDDIDGFKKLHFHIYQCLFKAMFKPAAFFKGLLLPLCRSDNFTLREAVVFGSLIKKVSIPQMHAAAAILCIAELDYTTQRALILQGLIEKNYTLPFRVLDGLVFHFLRMQNQQNIQLTVSWHQCLISFVQRYSVDISSEQRNALIELVKAHSHHKISPEILRILRTSESRNEESEANVPDYARDD